MTPRVKATKESIDKINLFFNKLKKNPPCASKDIIRGKDNLRTQGVADPQRPPVMSCTLVSDGPEGEP